MKCGKHLEGRDAANASETQWFAIHKSDFKRRRIPRSTLFVQVCGHKCHKFPYLWKGTRASARATFRGCIYLLFHLGNWSSLRWLKTIIYGSACDSKATISQVRNKYV